VVAWRDSFVSCLEEARDVGFGHTPRPSADECRSPLGSA
jgi:hypothetical protein